MKIKETKEMKELKKAIREIPDFPKKGILFYDVTTLMANGKAFSKALDLLVKRYKDKKIGAIAGIEARGFVFGAALADRLGTGIVLMRKKGKLPYKTIRESYSLEYGTDEIEMHVDAIKKNQRVLVVDDLLATGGTASAAARLIKKAGGKVVEAAFLVELIDLKGREKLKPVESFSLLQYEGE